MALSSRFKTNLGFALMGKRYMQELLDYLDSILKPSTTITVTAAEMDTLNATPKVILAAPGAGKAILVESVEVQVVVGVTPFELGSGVLEVRYTDGSGAKASADIPNATVESATNASYRAVAASCAPVANAAIVLCASSDVTAGDGSVKIRLKYRVIKTDLSD